MAVFLFDILNATGHVKPTLALAVALRKAGNKVFYTHTSRSIFSKYLEREGIGKIQYPDGVKDCLPDLVLLDQVLRDRADFYEHLQIPFIYVESALSGLIRQGVPPLDSGFIPKGTGWSDLICRLIWSLKPRSKVTTSVNQLVLAATPLDYPGLMDPHVRNAGPFSNDIKSRYVSPRQAYALYMRLNKSREAGKTILYCTLGTYHGFGNFRKVRRFYKLMRRLCERHPEYEAVLSITHPIQSLGLLPLPHNMHIFKWMNQTELLPYSDLVISHGGMNTLTECVWAEVPMLVYPLRFDEYGNAARIVYHGLGDRGNMRYATVDSLHQKIQEILKDKEEIKNRLVDMREAFERKNENIDNTVQWILSEY
ncbi:glycosyltransferase [Parabacteroides sp.]|uniref:glycosyltransferase n=1 Tax=Parabacteroides sp. TaxID=1869337 RepID=UPI00257D5D4D|nr:glycosyltransferase [Parabacteroides sp.]